jgi:hypothetical protein
LRTHRFIARGIDITSLELTPGSINCIVAKTTVSLLRFESLDSNPRGLGPLRPMPRVDLSGRRPVICQALDASIDAKLHAVGTENSLGQSTLDANAGPSSVANCGLIFIFDIRHPNRYIATKIHASWCRSSATRIFEEQGTPPEHSVGTAGPEWRKIGELKPIFDHSNGTDGLKKWSRWAVKTPSNNKEALQALSVVKVLYLKRMTEIHD